MILAAKLPLIYWVPLSFIVRSLMRQGRPFTVLAWPASQQNAALRFVNSAACKLFSCAANFSIGGSPPSQIQSCRASNPG